jgi:phage-related protein
LGQLAEQGHALRRPAAEYLRDDIYELRIRYGSVNYRILYFFHGRTIAVLAHGLTKEKDVPDRDIDLAVARKDAFMKSPSLHTAVMERDDEAEDH